MKKRLLILGVCGVLFAPQLQAQETFTCGLSKKLAVLYAENPQLEKDHEKLFLNGMHTEIKNGEKTTIFTIPVVFHIIHNYGSENISDQQVYDQMAILNRDYRLLNADTADVIPEFKQVYGDVGIEFKLASLDPFGNCTNGIEHIYSHETYQGDDYSKLHQWYRANYLNVWVVESMENGVAGYAYYPTATEGSGFFRDGVIILNDYIGSIGTSSAYNSRALTHEIGHYLGLSHTWGSTNDPGVACGDDYMADTPETKGSQLACNLNMAECNVGVKENVQNYMDYSYCSRMFTLDQASAMRNILQGEAGQRDQLIALETASATGIDLTNPPVCAPIADFNANKRFVCQGTAIQFTDFSHNATVTNREWIFEGGTPATSSAAQPTVTYSTGGYKNVKLIVSNASGTDTLEMDNYILVSENYADFIGPKSFDLEDNYVNWFRIDNPETNHAEFSLISSNGIDNSYCFKLNNYKNTDGAMVFTEDYFYYDRLGGSVDALITPSFDLSTTSGVTFTFNYAFATNATQVDLITDKVKIYSSKNCGETWTLRKSITGTELLTMGYAGYSDFAPSNNNQWKLATVNYSASNSDQETRFKIEFTASDFAGNLFIDDININGVLGLIQNAVDQLEVNVYPNPASSNSDLFVSYSAQNEDVEFILRDLQGKEITRRTKTDKNQQVAFNLTEQIKLPGACYFLEIRSGAFSSTKKIIVL
jgi:PKD repeat protein